LNKKERSKNETKLQLFQWSSGSIIYKAVISIYHRVDTTCQTQKYVMQQQLMSIDHRVDTNGHCCCNKCFWVWHVVSTLWSIDIVVVIRTFVSDTWHQLCDK
jgi:hypothetical protein